MSSIRQSIKSEHADIIATVPPRKEEKSVNSGGFVEIIDSRQFEKNFWKALFALLVIVLLAASMTQQVIIDNILKGLSAQEVPTAQQIKLPTEPTALQKKDNFLRVYADDVAYTKSTDLPPIYLAAKTVCADLDAGKTLLEVRADWVNNPRGTITNREVAPLTRDAILTLCPSHIDWLQIPPYSTVIAP